VGLSELRERMPHNLSNGFSFVSSPPYFSNVFCVAK